MLNSEFTNDAGEEKVHLNIGLPIDEIKNLTAEGLNEIFENVLAPTVANGMDISNLKIGNGKKMCIRDRGIAYVEADSASKLLGFSWQDTTEAIVIRRNAYGRCV